MWRGSAVEAGLDAWLYKRDRDDSLRRALDRFDLEACGICDDATNRERERVPAMLAIAMQATEQSPEPTLRQHPVEYWFDGIEVPVKGIIDYEWPDEGMDLKTTNRIQSEIPGGHARQVSLYRAARNKPYRLLYVSEKRFEFRDISDEEAKRHLKTLEWQAHAIRRVLSMFSDKHDLARIFVPDFDHFYWRSEASKRAAMEIWT